MKSALIHARIEPDLKEKVEGIMSELGLSPSEAITIFYRQIALRNGLPFEVRIPNRSTLQTFRDTDAGRNLKRFDSVNALIEDLSQ